MKPEQNRHDFSDQLSFEHRSRTQTAKQSADDWCANQRESIESRLAELVRDCAFPDPPSVSSAPLMNDVVEQAIVSDMGGKRLRALLLIATWQLAQSASSTASQAASQGVNTLSASHPMLSPATIRDLACSIELFQTGALVHDDIMDDSDERRRRPSAHRALARAFSDFSPRPLSKVQANQSGVGLGIMLGDLLATLSLQVAVRALEEPRQVGGQSLLSAITSHLLLMQQNVEIGQVLDEANSNVPLSEPSALVRNCEAIYTRKTASYTCITPLALGLICAGFDPHTADKWAHRIGQPLGIAFQISDDLKDIVPATPATGKPLFGDIREGKRTILLADSLRLLDEDQRRELIGYYTAPSRSAEDVAHVRDLFVSSGGIDASFERLTRLQKTVTTQADLLIEQMTAANGENAITGEQEPNSSASLYDASAAIARWKNLLDSFFVSGDATHLHEGLSQ